MSGSRWNGAISHSDIACFSSAESFLKVTYEILSYPVPYNAVKLLNNSVLFIFLKV